MEKHLLKKRIDAAAGRIPADIVIENCKIIDVYNSSIIEGKSIAIVDGCIAGVGDYKGRHTIDAKADMQHRGLLTAISTSNPHSLHRRKSEDS